MNNHEDFEMQVLILSAFLIFIFLVGFIVYFILLYKKRQEQNRLEQENIQSAFRHELLKTQVEVQEQTLTNISREIHDNITQVLSFVKLNLGMINHVDETVKAKVNESRELIAQTISDLRNLSKSMSFEHIAQLGLVRVLETEAVRIKNTGLLNISLTVQGDNYSIGEQRELVLFRIFQEALNNTLKHANAKCLNICLQYSEQIFNLTLEDDGNGFLPDELPNGGSGLKNIKSRAALIGATTTINAAPGNGCCIKITLNLTDQQNYTDGDYPNSPG